jgi:hypothetical protein
MARQTLAQGNKSYPTGHKQKRFHVRLMDKPGKSPGRSANIVSSNAKAHSSITT